jgi:hypothetical protein
MAAPHVTGAVACLYQAAGRPLSAREIRHLLVQSVDAVPADVPDRDRFGHGYFNLDRALERTRTWARERAAPPREEEPVVHAELGSGSETSPPVGAATVVDSGLAALEASPAPELAEAHVIYLRDLPRLQAASLAPVGTALAAGPGIASTYARIGGLMEALGAELGIDPAAALAVWQVESGGRGYTPGRTILRVENHLLFDAWGIHDPATFDAHFQFGTRPPLDSSTMVCGRRPCDRRWRCHRSRENASDEYTCDHTGQSREQKVLALATQLAGEETALRCSSMGGPQILGSNHARLGYSTAREMRDAFQADERFEVLGFFDFCRGDHRLVRALRGGHWADFARAYNGPGQVEEYGRRVEDAYAMARGLLRRVQQTPAHERWEEIAEPPEVEPEAEEAPPEVVLTAATVNEGGVQERFRASPPEAELEEALHPGAATSEPETSSVIAVAEAEDPLLRVQSCPVDAYAYERTGSVCSDGPQPGTRALRKLLRERFGERLAEIYNCRPIRGGTSLSLHAEGRAVDYYLNAHDPDELALGDRIVQWLLGSDDRDNSHAVARRLGVQEVIWNHRIWTSGRRRDEGMRPYGGVDPHTNHVHVGQHRLGAAMQTTYWVGC